MFLRDSLTKYMGVMFIASMLANVANYFFHIFMSRALGPGDYGILASLSSLFLILSVPIGTIQTTVAKYTSHFKALENYIRISQLFSTSLKKLFLIGIVSFLIFIGFSKYIASFLQTPSLLPIIIIGTCLPVSFILPLIWGELQGLQEFNYLGSNIVLQAFSKLALGILLVYLGWRVNGALLGYVLSPLIAFSFAIIYLLHIFQRQKNAENSQETFQDSKHFQKLDSTIEYSSKDSFPKEILNFSEKQIGLPNIFIYSLPVALTILCFTLLTNGDVLLVKHFFVPYQAGYYSAASIVAKIIIYLPGAIGIVMFPKTSELYALNQDSLGVLKKSLLYTVIICGGILIVQGY